MNKNIRNCLPCQNFIMCGSCPYVKRCRYIHDPRIQDPLIHNLQKQDTITQNLPSKYKKNSRTFIKKNHNLVDALYWPYDIIINRNNIKCYTIKKPSINSDKKHIELYSIWNNFIDVCYTKNDSNEKINTINKYTNKSRLRIFLNMSL